MDFKKEWKVTFKKEINLFRKKEKMYLKIEGKCTL